MRLPNVANFVPRGQPMPSPQSLLEETFNTYLREPGSPIPEPYEREYQFHETRKWRFDFAWPDHRVAVEIEGITRGKGRHQSYDGFVGDCEKYEAAQRAGWIVYRIPGPWLADGDRLLGVLREFLDARTTDAARAAIRRDIEKATR